MAGEQPYNAAVDFLDRNVEEGRGGKPAVHEPDRSLTYGELLDAAARVGPMLAAFGVEMESRVALAVFDSLEFPILFWGAMRAGVVPVLLNTRLTADQYRFHLADSRAKAVFVSAPLLPLIEEAARGLITLKAIIVVGACTTALPTFDDLLAAASPAPATHTSADDVAYCSNRRAPPAIPRASFTPMRRRGSFPAMSAAAASTSGRKMSASRRQKCSSRTDSATR